MTNWAKIILGDSRSMYEVEPATVDLIVTSPPYWQIKDYGITGQIGYGQTLHEYLRDLYYTWSECYRVLQDGGRFCLNIGDQFARSAVYGRYKVIPLHAEFIAQCEAIGFDFLGSIIWQKKTTMNTTGGAVVMGSYPFPPNGLVELDYEFILIFKKPGTRDKVAPEIKEASKLTKEEWKEYFLGHWYFGGTRQLGHEAMFPEELPRRLIRMFSLVGDTVLDPFLGSGTTAKAALDLGRNAVGYEINADFLELIKEKIGLKDRLWFNNEVQIIGRDEKQVLLPNIDYLPRIQDAQSLLDAQEFEATRLPLHKVTQIIDETSIKLDNGQVVKFLGVKIDRKDEALHYLNKKILGKQVIIKNETPLDDNGLVQAYVYLKNKIFINTYLIKSGLASPDPALEHKFANKFMKLMREREGAVGQEDQDLGSQ